MLKLSRITLTTNHLPELSQLLSQLFETEIIPQTRGVLLKGEQDFLLLPQTKGKTKESSFLYVFDEEEEFDSYFNKVNFMRYRQGQEPLKLSQDEKERFFKVLDPDGRTWQFSYSSLQSP